MVDRNQSIWDYGIWDVSPYLDFIMIAMRSHWIVLRCNLGLLSEMMTLGIMWRIHRSAEESKNESRKPASLGSFM